MLNYEVDPALLRPHVPAHTELDLFEGRALISLVGFLFLDTKLWGVPIPFHRNFEEVNLRFYVRREANDGIRRGVVFIREIVPKAAIAFTARVFYNENYAAMPMRHGFTGDEFRYEWRRGGGWSHLALTRGGSPFLAGEGSEEQFISEHYFGYASQRDGSTFEYRVEHPTWRVWRAVETNSNVDVATLYGEKFVEPLSRAPTSAFLADGSAVSVAWPERLAVTGLAK